MAVESSLGDLTDSSSLHLTEVLTQNDEKTFVLKWSINDYKKIKIGMKYVSNYICIGKNKNRLFLVRHDAKVKDPASNRTEVHLLLGLHYHSEIKMSCYILGEDDTKFKHNDSLKLSLHLYPGKACAFRETPQITPRAKLTVMFKFIVSMTENEDASVHLSLQETEKYSSMSTNYEPFFETGRFSDFSIIVGNKVFSVHKVILGAVSPVFAAMLENKMKENLENKIIIEDSDSETFGELLRYIYTGKTGPLDYELALALLTLADMYDVQRLKQEVAKYLLDNLSLEYALRILILADIHNAAKLKVSTTKFVANNLKALRKTPEWISFRSRVDLVDDILDVLEDLSPETVLYKDFRPVWKPVQRSNNEIHMLHRPAHIRHTRHQFPLLQEELVHRLQHHNGNHA